MLDNNLKICVWKWWTSGKLDQMGVWPTHFQIGTIIIILDLPSESHHRTSSSPLLRTFLLLSYRKWPMCLGWVRKNNSVFTKIHKWLGCQFFSHSCKVDFSTNIRKFYGGLNNIIFVLGKNRNEISCVHLVKTYYVPLLLYGCEVWNLSCAEYRHLNVDLEKNLIVVGGRARGSCCFTVRSYLWHI